MKLSEVKLILPDLAAIEFEFEDGTVVPEHFHVTEVGVVSKHFIDCGGTVRQEAAVNFQLWEANDFDHRLKPIKLLNIINLSEQKLALETDWEVEVEYQGQTIERYDLTFNGKRFVLVSKKTNCLAPDKCGIPKEKLPKNSCTPGGGCC